MQSVERTAIREYVGTIAKVSGETFLLTYQTQKGSAKLVHLIRRGRSLWAPRLKLPAIGLATSERAR